MRKVNKFTDHNFQNLLAFRVPKKIADRTKNKKRAYGLRRNKLIPTFLFPDDANNRVNLHLKHKPKLIIRRSRFFKINFSKRGQQAKINLLKNKIPQYFINNYLRHTINYGLFRFRFNTIFSNSIAFRVSKKVKKTSHKILKYRPFGKVKTVKKLDALSHVIFSSTRQNFKAKLKLSKMVYLQQLFRKIFLNLSIQKLMVLPSFSFTFKRKYFSGEGKNFLGIIRAKFKMLNLLKLLKQKKAFYILKKNRTYLGQFKKALLNKKYDRSTGVSFVLLKKRLLVINKKFFTTKPTSKRNKKKVKMLKKSLRKYKRYPKLTYKIIRNYKRSRLLRKNSTFFNFFFYLKPSLMRNLLLSILRTSYEGLRKSSRYTSPFPFVV